jgi:FkbH-like protein
MVEDLNLLKAILEDRLALFRVSELKNLLNEFADDDFQYRSKIAILTNYTADSLSLLLAGQLMMFGIKATSYCCGYDRWFDEIIDENSVLNKFEPDIAVLHISLIGLSNYGCWRPEEFIENLSIGVKRLTDRSVKVLLVFPEPLDDEIRPNTTWMHWRFALIQKMFELADSDLVEIFDPVPSMLEFAKKFRASQYWFSAKLPFHPEFFGFFSVNLARALKSLIFKPIKLIAVDLDNTLWGGIVGEDGVSNLELDPFLRGGVFIRLQRWLKDFADKGGLLAILSKNNENDVREVFEKRSEMLLKWEDFVAKKVDWNDKGQNLLEIVSELNIGLQSVAFIDDSPFERDSVRRSCPEVFVVDFQQIENLPDLLNRMPVFDQIFRISAEDKDKGKIYQRESLRKELEKSFSTHEEFLRALHITIQPQRICAKNIKRVTELVSKTNQFNLTTLRLNNTELMNLANDEKNYAFCFKTSDRYGDHGITAVFIAVPDDEKTYRILVWLQSCRVMGREIEAGHLKHLCDWLNQRNIELLIGEYFATDKNLPVKDIFAKMGFFKINSADSSASFGLKVQEKSFAPLLRFSLDE